VSVAEFEEAKSRLEKHILQLFKSNSTENVRNFLNDKHWKNLSTNEIASVVVRWIEHIVYDDQRVLDAVLALQKKDLTGFGRLLSDSGKSAIYGYELNEDSDEITWLYETVMKNSKTWGIMGIRNMGGGFNATTLALVRIDSVDTYRTELNKAYGQKFNSSYSFLEFVPSPSAGRLSLNQ
jgi:galactokinase